MLFMRLMRVKSRVKKRAIFIVWAMVLAIILFTVGFYVVRVIYSTERQNVVARFRNFALDIAVSEIERFMAERTIKSFDKKVAVAKMDKEIYQIFKVSENVEEFDSGKIFTVKVLPPNSKRGVVLKVYVAEPL